MMHNSETELIFPARVIPALRDLRGDSWQTLVDRVNGLEPTHPERLAFVLMMVKLGGCASCQADSFRALRGCAHCANQTIRRFRGSDQDLFDQMAAARKEVEHHLDHRQDHLRGKR